VDRVEGCGWVGVEEGVGWGLDLVAEDTASEGGFIGEGILSVSVCGGGWGGCRSRSGF
jgi:hypothetical protein